MSGSGSLSCLASAGCEILRIEAVSFTCRDRQNSISAIKVEGSILEVYRSSFNSCWSDTDGGAIQAYELANVSLQSCDFRNTHSSGFGGAVAAFGSSLYITDSVFTNCSSASGGGAIWASAYEGCYGSIQPSSTVLTISYSVFHKCSTQGSGGAVLVNAAATSANGETLDLMMLDTSFVHCSAGADGGAIQTAGTQVVARLELARFVSCAAAGSGGAISAIDSSSISLVGCSITGSFAAGLGGGAMHFKASRFLSYNLSVTHNAAPFGGGGVLFWQLSLLPATLGCPAGTSSANTSCPLPCSSTSQSQCIIGTCLQCARGTYQAQQDSLECIPCPSGMFSEIQGSKGCTSCPSGTFSSVVGANSSETCMLCLPGTFSNVQGLSACSDCSDGNYSSAYGSVACRSCGEGFYSGQQAAWCSECVTGIYTGSSYLSQRSVLDFAQCPRQTAGNGSIGRFVPNGMYSDNELMFWTIAPFNASNISLEFLRFQTKADHDFVHIYACANISCAAPTMVLLGSFSGSAIPRPVICNTSVMLVVWSSSANSSGVGWSAIYQRGGPVGRSLRTLQTIHNRNLNPDLLYDDAPVSESGISGSVAHFIGMRSKSLPWNRLVQDNKRPEIVHARSGRRPMQIRSFQALSRFSSDNDIHPICTLWSHSVDTPRIGLKRSKPTLNALSAHAARKNQRDSHSGKKSLLAFRRNVENTALLINLGYNFERPLDFCGTNNSALYGACIASGYERLSVSLTADQLYAGVAFNLTVIKLDAYDNVILSDSTSVLQAMATSNVVPGEKSDAVSIVGPSLAQLTRGVAKFLFAVEPTFSKIDLNNQSAILSGQIYFYLNGSDSQAGSLMTSSLMPLDLEQGQNVCPAGYILVLSQDELNEVAAVCQLCKPGTYSLRPLAHMPGSALTPSCINCPAGGICTKGGDDVQFEVGTWAEIEGIYVLTSCPEGFELINSTAGTSKGYFSNDAQECKACLPEQYILNPNADTCQNCPPGLSCTGTSAVVPVIKGSTWIPDGTIYRLTGCPAGYSISSTGISGNFEAAVQQCSPCPKGEECISPPCSVCRPCDPGFYKAAAGVDACVACPADTYSTEAGGQSLSACQRCPTFASTQGHVNQTSQAGCICDTGYYPAYASDSLTCVACPAGATCPDGSCALSNYASQSCPDGGGIVGDWVLDNSSGLYVLNGCPAGYYLNAQQCQLCPALYYCSGSTLPSTPCASGEFSIPGSASKKNCTSAVFVVLVVNLPILRPFFTDQTSSKFQIALAFSAGTDSKHVIVDIIQPGNNPSTTDVTSRIATVDASTAAALVSRLNVISIQSGFYTRGIQGAYLMSVEVTACVAGYELQAQLPPSICQPCPANYFCLGGTAARASCPDGGYSAIAANSSNACTQTAVVLVVDLPLSPSNFTSNLQLGFLHALALIAGVPSNKVAILSFDAVSVVSARRAMKLTDSNREKFVDILTNFASSNSGPLITRTRSRR